MIPPRRIVTGHDLEGRSIVTSEGPTPVVIQSPLQKDLAFYEIWNTRESPAIVDSGADPTLGRKADTHPPKNGTIIRFVDLPPEGSNGPELDPVQSEKLFAAVGLKGVRSRHTKTNHPLMHRTESVDYGIVLSGECYLILDDQEIHLKTGDVVVQRGTVHAWSNRANAPCRMAFILVDGRFSPETAQQIASLA